ncbi:hypothetical protein FACS1894159_02060 [Bacteroidia bacterium]|nr:hypothetical protein FACS1894159_02060 [Bacteroidia bacterium]
MSESQNIKYKSSWRDECLKWICGFANAQDNKIYIGKDDDNKGMPMSVSMELLYN